MTIALCDALRAFSVDTWDRLSFSYNHDGVKTSEETLTENLVYSLFQMSGSIPTDIQIWHSTAEWKNGNDLEIFVQRGDRVLWLPTQAKRLYLPEQKYKSLSYRVGDPAREQLDLLLDYANSSQAFGHPGFPLYLLFNYAPSYPCPAGISDPKEYGASIIPAQHLKDNFSPSRPGRSSQWRIPRFDDLHFEEAVPLHYLCRLLGLGSTGYSDISGGAAAITAAFDRYAISLNNLSFEDVFLSIGWDRITPLPGLGRLPVDRNTDLSDSPNTEIRSDYGFRPRYRILLSDRERPSTAISTMH